MSTRPFSLRRGSSSPHPTTTLPSLTKIGLSTAAAASTTPTGMLSPAHPGTPGSTLPGTHSPGGSAWQSYLSPSLFTASALHASTSDLRSTSRPPSPGSNTAHDKQQEVNLFEQSFGGAHDERISSSAVAGDISGAAVAAKVSAVGRHAGLSGTMTPGRESKLRNVSSHVQADDDDEDEDENVQMLYGTTQGARDEAAAAAAAALVGVLSTANQARPAPPSSAAPHLPRRPTLQESRSSELSIATSAASVASRVTTLTTPDRSPPPSAISKPTAKEDHHEHFDGRHAMKLDLQDLSLTLPGRQSSSFANSPLPSYRTHFVGDVAIGSGTRTPDVMGGASGTLTPSYLTSSLTRLVDEPEKVLSPPLVVDMNGYVPASATPSGQTSVISHVTLPSLPSLPTLTTKTTTTTSTTTTRRGRKPKSTAVAQEAVDEIVGEQDDDDDEYTERPSAGRRNGHLVHSPQAGSVDRGSLVTNLHDDVDEIDATAAGSSFLTMATNGTAKLSALERNRIAASKSRKRKRERMQNMEQVATDLSMANAALQATALQLKSELFALRSQLTMIHHDQSRCECAHVQGYLKRERSGQGISVIVELSGETLSKQYGDVGKWGRGGGADASAADDDVAGAEFVEGRSPMGTAKTNGRTGRGTKRTRANAAASMSEQAASPLDVDELDSDA
ncbi:hypothetical protein OIV83_006339 [Microbotryomycetes sp. JL201]|nr:hypothetical protein OIV83_006339 [Microbotryomycetes sp. JL201]